MFFPVFDLAVRHKLEFLGLCNRVGARVRLKIGSDDIDSALRGSVAVSKHLESFSDARRITQIDF
jgi:hypothetical protein